MDEKQKIRVRRKSQRFDKYKWRKSLFWFAIIFLVLGGLLLFVLLRKPNVEHRVIRVAACGCVNHEAVFTLREGADVAMLVTMAKGLHKNADVFKIDFDHILENDTVYHFPCKSGEVNAINAIDEINKSNRLIYRNLYKEVTAEANEKDIKMYSILYVGMPAVYVLINYYPEFQRINFIHLPHSAMFLNNEYRLIDLFFTLDIKPLKDILQDQLAQKIDYFLIQDRFNFIDLIDLLGGVDINIDKPYAEEYKLTAGMSKLDGYHSWEYIRFLDWRNVKMNVRSEKKRDLVRSDNFSIAGSDLERIYEMRNQRQRHVLEGMRKSFVSLSTVDQLFVVENFKNVFRTDMDTDFLMSLYKDILSTPNFSYGNLPGYYSTENNKVFFFPDMASFEMLRKREIRTYLQQRRSRQQVVY